MSSVVGDLSQARISTVRRLLEQAPDTAVQSLEAFLDGEAGAEAPSDAVLDLIAAERNDRRLRNAVFAPLAPVFALRPGLMRLRLPPETPALLWRALKSEGPDGLAKAASGFAEGQAAAGLADEANAILDDLCRRAARGLGDRAHGYGEVVDQLALPAADLSDLILLLNLTPLLRTAVAGLPAWMTARAGEYDLAINDLVDFAAAEDEAGAPMLMEALLGHLDRPAHVLRLISVVMDRPTDRMFALCEYASFGERLLDDVDRQIDIIRAFEPRRGLEGGVAVAAASTAAHVTLTEFEQNLALGKDGVWGARIAAQRRNLALAMEMRLREVEGAVSNALPALSVRLSGKLMRGSADLSRAPDQRAVDRAVGLIALVEGCRPSAALAGYGAIRKKVLETLDGWLESYTQDLLERLHKGGPNCERMRAYLDVAAEFTAMVHGPEAAALIRRRVAAA
ncbi:MAG: hypothetical protein ACYDD1_11480 [Caulobacteraceae bacterium]